MRLVIEIAPMIAWWLGDFAIQTIIAAVELRGICLFRNMSALPIIKKRYPNLVIAEAAIVFLITIVGIPFLLYAYLLTDNAITHYAAQFTFVALSYAYLLLELSRIWLMSFKLHILSFSNNEEWKSEIDEGFADKTWYWENKDTYGNEEYVIKIAIALYVLIVALSILLSLAAVRDDDNSYAIAVVSISLLVQAFNICFAGYTYIKCRTFAVLEDQLLFFYELKATGAIWLGCWIGYGFIACAGFLTSHVLIIVARLAVVHVCIVAPSLLSSAIIPLKILKKQAAEDIAMLIAASRDDIDNQTLAETLQDEKLFRLFIEWMSKEMATEIPFCFMELLQFKRSLRQDDIETAAMLTPRTSLSLQSEEEEEEEVRERPGALSLLECQFGHLSCCNYPKSTIVYKSRPDLTQYERQRAIAHDLYEKYLKVASPYEINIAYAPRAAFAIMDRNRWAMGNRQLFEVFDETLATQHTFMETSFGKYKKWKQRANDV